MQNGSKYSPSSPTVQFCGVGPIHKMFSEVQYLAAAFELFAGANFIFTPGALLDGCTPQ